MSAHASADGAVDDDNGPSYTLAWRCAFMSKSFTFVSRLIPLTWARRPIGCSLLLVSLLACGCSKPAQIRTYTVPKFKDRMLAGMTIDGDKAWFFKMMGPAEMVKAQVEPFKTFVKSVRFQDGRPSWQLPNGWTEEPGSDPTRYATIKTGDSPGAVNATVVFLRAPPGNKKQYELANVNRWLGQLGADAVTGDQLDDRVERFAVNGTEMVWLDVTGARGSGGGMVAPFMAGNRPHPPIDQTESRAAAPEDGGVTSSRGQDSSGDPLIRVTEPKSWKPGRLSSMRKAAFIASDGDASAEITVIDLAAAAGDLLDNVNRWRGQVGLEAVDKPTLNDMLVEIAVDDVSGKYVEMFGPEDAKDSKAILGVIAIRGERAWFYKLTGPSRLAAMEKERFLQFVRSTEFPK